ncbi:MAG: MerR family transcriptional regulator [Myxococcales bacterium]|nr:MerR family transcriptional regulator [Myxococcales bacterium]
MTRKFTKLPEIADGLYPMRAVTKLTGLNPDTIRVWERRYEAVAPDRTSGNARRYSSVQVRRLVMLREAVHRGHSIGDVARLNNSVLEALLTTVDTWDTYSQEGHDISSGMFVQLAEEYLSAIARFDAPRAALILNRAASLLDPLDFALRVVRPVLCEVGERWHRGEMNVTQEHLVSVQMKSLLLPLMRFAISTTNAPRALFATPQGHTHEFGIMIAAVIAGGRGYGTTYIGPDIPVDDLFVAAELFRTDVVILSIVSTMSNIDASVLAGRLEWLATRVQTWLGCPNDHPILPYLTEVRPLHRYEDLDAALAKYRTTVR